MSANTAGHLFRYTTWGESHGPAIGCVVDGAPSQIELSESDIQQFLDRRKPGQNRFTTQRQEEDKVKILSGVFEGRTTGAPISLLIENTDARSKDYSDIKDKYRPGHADFTYDRKYGFRDYRGGGRSSARETASRVAAGAVARKVLHSRLGDAVNIRASVVQVGPHKINRDNWDWAQAAENQFFTPDADIIPVWEAFLDKTRKAGSSAGAIVEVVASGIPAGFGAPVVDKLDADLAKAMMGINAVKGVEIGAGFASVEMGGEVNSDQIRIIDGKPHFLSNHAGGILGGISTGQDIVVRIAFKPTSSILTPMQTINSRMEETEIITKGRHDPCVGLRGAPVAEAMMALVLCDHLLRHAALKPG
ncbi:MAG TPA: chorismate synthase [Patescibacteria group bacterium]|nr:chorismate synthase [Patescibacteria group bacterium]